MNKLSFIIPVLILTTLLGCTQQAQVPPATPTPQPAEVTPPPQSNTEIPISTSVTPTPSSKIAFVRDYGDYYGWDICTANSDGTDIRRITKSSAMDSHPVWSPDGSQIAFESTREWHNMPSVYTMDAGGNNVKCLTPERQFCKAPAWSPDSKRIAYCVFIATGGPGLADVFVPDSISIMDSDGGNKQYMSEGGRRNSDAYCPSWLPDGQHIAFLYNRSIWVIHTINTDGSDAKEYLTCISPSSCGVRFKAGGYPTLSVSPDGKLVAFDSQDYTGRWDIYVMSFGGGEITKWTGTISGSCYCPTWSPDGSKIAFTFEQESNTNIYVMNSDGSNPTLLIKDGMFPSWQREK